MSGAYYYAQANGPFPGRLSRTDLGDDQNVSRWINNPWDEETVFAWGQKGNSADHLAYTLIFDATGNDESAQIHYRMFADQVVSEFSASGFVIHVGCILSWLSVVSDDDAANYNVSRIYSEGR